MSLVAGELEVLGFEEVEPGLIADTGENRMRLMRLEGSWSWERVQDEEGEYTGLIRPLDETALTRRRESFHKVRRPILEDPENPWSDYLHPDEWPLDVDVPWWVSMRLRRWQEQAAEGVPEAERRPFPRRCTQLRVDNTRCWNWAPNPDEMSRCKKHVGYTRQAVRQSAAYARDQVFEAAPGAADTLIYLSQFADGEAVRLKASTEILDRAGVHAKQEIDINATVTQTDPAELLHEKLDMLRKRHTPVVEEETDTPLALPAGEIVEGEVVEERESA